MKKLIYLLLSLAFMPALAQQAEQDAAFVKANYTKFQYQIPMRDGTKLFTQVYVPKDASPSNTYPMLMQRTCYDIAPYSKDEYPGKLFYSRYMMYEKYIFVEQDVRGRWMSEGTFTNMTPHIPNKTKPTDIDEASDTYDTIDWLVKNVANNNGKLGQYGISYPGFYTIAGALCGHPALKASSPQAPVSDFFFEDFHHNGAFTLGYGLTFPVFGVQHPNPTTESWYDNTFPKINTKDGYDWYKSMTPLSKFNEAYKDNFFWKEHVDHPNYDDFWQKRSITPHLKSAKNMPAMMTVGGWFDAEDIVGPLNIYKTLEKNKDKNQNILVMGPFGHGDWSRDNAKTMHSNIYFGDSIAQGYQREIEMKFFKHHLKGNGIADAPLSEAHLFDTGLKKWQDFTEWPSKAAQTQTFFLGNSGKLTDKAGKGMSTFISDPQKPVPYTEDNKQILGFSPRAYMSEDQRFAGRRSDVLVFETDVLTEDLTLAGEITANINFSTDQTDADFFVKVIDVYPGDEPQNPNTPAHITLGGYQMMLRSEVMRARFRESFSNPKAVVSYQKTALAFRLQDVLHTLKKGHKLMIQVQSTAFPLFDINPQKYVPNIFKAEISDFTKATHKVFEDSNIQIQVLKN